MPTRPYLDHLTGTWVHRSRIDAESPFDAPIDWTRVRNIAQDNGWVWDEGIGRFTMDGEVVSYEAILEATKQELAGLDDQVASVSTALYEGQAAPAEWKGQMVDLTAAAALVFLLFGFGGNTPSRRAERMAGRKFRGQLKYLERFASQLADGGMTQAGLIARSQLYIHDAQLLYGKAQELLHPVGLFPYYRNVLGPCEHCAQCPEQSAMGIVPRGSLAPLGERLCKWRCCCQIAYHRRQDERKDSISILDRRNGWVGGPLNMPSASYVNWLADVAIDRLDSKVAGRIPCNAERGWVGIKAYKLKGQKRGGCKRARSGTASRVRGVERVRRGKKRLPDRARLKEPQRNQAKSSRGGPLISPKNVVTTDERFNVGAINTALNQISTNGAQERVSAMRSIIEAQGIQSVFNSSRETKGKLDKLADGIENKLPSLNRVKAELTEFDKKPRTKKNLARKEWLKAGVAAYQEGIVGQKANASGFTSKDWRHVVVSPESRGQYNEFKVSGGRLKEASDRAFDASANGDPLFSASRSTKGPEATLITYIHEVGHQIEWVSLADKTPPGAARPKIGTGLTKYGKSNPREQFAEHFALWVLDADRLKKEHPKMHKFMTAAVNRAGTARRRLDALSKVIKKSPEVGENPAETKLGIKAFNVINRTGSATSIYKTLTAINGKAKTSDEIEETGAAMEAFIVMHGDKL